METKSVPALRFKRYTDTWEQRTLGDMADIVGGGTPSTANPSYWDGDINWYSPVEIDKKIYLSSSQKKITKEGYDNCSAKILPIGTVLFTSRAGVGKTAILEEPGCTNQGFQSIVPRKKELDSYFIFTRTKELKQYGERVGAGSTFIEVSGKQMANMQLMMPQTLFEQQRIGNLYQALDHLITLYQRKYEKLQNIKKSLLQKMFPSEGEDVPAVRFAGFTEPWEQRKLGDIATFINGRAYKQEELLETGKYKVLRVGNFYTNDTWYYSNLEMDEKYYANYGDLLYTWSATFGPHIWLGEKVIYHYHIWKIELSDVVDKQFIVQLLEQDRTNILSTYNGSTMIHVTKSDMEQKQVFIPSILEQRKVGSYLKRIDALLTLHQREIERLQKIKLAALQKMFV